MGTLTLTPRCLCSITLIAVCWVATLASAVPIPIKNHSFEDEIFPHGDYAGRIRDWTISCCSDRGTWRPTAESFNLSTIDGSQIAYFHTGRSAAQQLNTGLVLGRKYQLSALLGALSSGMYTRGGSLELWAGGSVANGNVVGGTIVGSLIVADNQLSPGLFLPFSTEITSPTSGPLAGQLLSVRFVSNGVEAELDRVQLEVVESPGDFDADGDVDGRDFLVWQRNPSVGELADWQANYGSISLAAVPVPEPSTLVLLIVASVLWAHRSCSP